MEGGPAANVLEGLAMYLEEVAAAKVGLWLAVIPITKLDVVAAAGRGRLRLFDSLLTELKNVVAAMGVKDILLWVLAIGFDDVVAAVSVGLAMGLVSIDNWEAELEPRAVMPSDGLATDACMPNPIVEVVAAPGLLIVV